MKNSPNRKKPKKKALKQPKAKTAAADAESSKWLSFTKIGATLDDVESGGVDVGFSELELSKPSAGALDDVFGTIVLFKPIDD